MVLLWEATIRASTCAWRSHRKLRRGGLELGLRGGVQCINVRAGSSVLRVREEKDVRVPRMGATWEEEARK